ncbi:MAG TPA: helix-turn-helix domain-containing protein [Solirubrobacteraceae bacterium]|nr:helix-turn-helix domain-containing protein [Solirubrobacteraceae bacterium]
MPATEPRHARRRERERDIVDATRALFDEQGMQDAPIERIARAVGINKAVIYRHFGSKEELFVLAVTRYLDELAGENEGVEKIADPYARLTAMCEAYTGFCLRYPAFLDCALSLMRRPAAELRERVSEAVWVRLGQAMARCLAPLSRVLAEGTATGAFAVEDPDFTANHMWTQALGTMHLARLGVGVREAAPGVPGAFGIDPERVRAACVRDAIALALAAPAQASPSSSST